MAAAARLAMVPCAAAPAQDGYGTISRWRAAEPGRLGRAPADPPADARARRGEAEAEEPVKAATMACVVVRAQPRLGVAPSRPRAHG